jgi:hypothetical protein
MYEWWQMFIFIPMINRFLFILISLDDMID